MKKIPINKPSITSKEIEYVNDAITNGWGDKCYEYITKFEKLFRDHVDSKYSSATSSCTGAIHLALMAMGVEKGDEVIVPEITWIATVEPVLYIGAKPVIVDVLEDTWCIDPNSIERAITKKTKVIIPVHLYGNVCEMDSIMDIAKKYNLKVLEDAAEGIGSKYKGKRVGSIGDAGVFSFHGTKTVTTGEGGIIVSNSRNLIDKVKILNDHGRNPKDPDHKPYWMRNYGYKYKIANVQAAIGCAQMERIDQLIEKKTIIFKWYKELLKSLPLELNTLEDQTKSGYWLPTIIFKEEFNQKEFFKYGSERGIDFRPFFVPLSSLPFFEKVSENINSYRLYNRGVNLPSYHEMTKEDCTAVVNIIKSFLKAQKINDFKISRIQ